MYSQYILIVLSSPLSQNSFQFAKLKKNSTHSWPIPHFYLLPVPRNHHSFLSFMILISQLSGINAIFFCIWLILLSIMSIFSLGSYNKNTSLMIEQQIFLTFLQSGKSRHQKIWCLVRACFLVHRCLPFCCVLKW